MGKIAESSSLKTKKEIPPYQFEPQLDSDASDGWETIDEEGEDSNFEVDIKKKGRNDVDEELWCSCSHCQQKKC